MIASMTVVNPNLPRLLSGRLPFFYGWIILACLCCAGFSRQGPAVATLSVFVEPLTREFSWSRTAEMVCDVYRQMGRVSGNKDDARGRRGSRVTR